MKIAEVRVFEGLSSYKLRRARRLYKHLVTPLVHKHKKLALVFAYRGIKAGLWSENTGIKDVTFNLIRAAYKRYGSDCEWWEYCRSEQCQFLWYEAKKYFTRTSSGIVQVQKVRIRF